MHQWGSGNLGRCHVTEANVSYVDPPGVRFPLDAIILGTNSFGPYWKVIHIVHAKPDSQQSQLVVHSSFTS